MLHRQAGGADLAFPHHAYQAAMVEAATGVAPFARRMLHVGEVRHDGAKMAKSTGNIFTLPDLLERGAKASAIRYTFLTAHYRSKVNFTWEALASAAESVGRLHAVWQRLSRHPRARERIDQFQAWLAEPLATSAEHAADAIERYRNDPGAFYTALNNILGPVVDVGRAENTADRFDLTHFESVSLSGNAFPQFSCPC